MGAQFEVEIDIDLEDIVPGFVENRKKEIKKLELLIEESDFSTIETISHKIAGNAGGYGFDKLGDLGREMEYASQKKNIEKIKENFLAMFDYLNNVVIKYV